MGTGGNKRNLRIGCVPFVAKKTVDETGLRWTQWNGALYSFPQMFGILGVLLGTLMVIFPGQKHYFTWSGAMFGICTIVFGAVLCVVAWYLADFRLEIRLDIDSETISWSSRSRQFSICHHSAAIEQIEMIVRRVDVSTDRGLRFWKGFLVLLREQESMVALAAFRKEEEIDDVLRELGWPFEFDRSQMHAEPLEAIGVPAWMERKLW